MNQHSKCSVDDCWSLRTRFGLYCRKHKRRLAMYGSTSGKPLPKQVVAGIALRAQRLLSANEDHPGLARATGELQRRLDEARDTYRTTGAPNGAALYWSRLAGANVTPLQILSAVVAVIVLDRENHRALPNQKALEYALARAVFGLAPQGKSPPGARILAQTGREMIEQYAGLIVSTVVALQAAEEDERKRDADMQAPLRPAP